jgi:uncharacterized protein YdaU (DUF1376 family)
VSDERLPWMKLWVYNFIGETVAWNGVARGLYAQLLILEWASGPLPDDAAELASILRYDLATFAAAWATVRSAFESTSKGLVNHSLEAERAEALESRDGRSKAGKTGADARWKGNRNGNRTANANGNANGKTHADAMPSSISISSTIRNTCESQNPEGEPGKETHARLSKEAHRRGWNTVRDAYPTSRYTATQNTDWGKAKATATQLVDDCRATWESLRTAASAYASYCEQQGRAPMNVAVFFCSEKPLYWQGGASQAPAPVAQSLQ